MQCIDRHIEISVFLVQPGELGFEFARIFIGHVCGGRKTDRREIKAVDALWKLSSLRAVIASDLGLSRADLPGDISTIATARCASALISRVFPAWFPYSRFVTYEVLKITSRRLISIDRTNRSCTLRRLVESKVRPFL